MVDKILEKTKTSDYGLRSLVHAVVASESLSEEVNCHDEHSSSREQSIGLGISLMLRGLTHLASPSAMAQRNKTTCQYANQRSESKSKKTNVKLRVC